MVQVAGVKDSGQVALIGVQGRQKCQPRFFPLTAAMFSSLLFHEITALAA